MIGSTSEMTKDGLHLTNDPPAVHDATEAEAITTIKTILALQAKYTPGSSRKSELLKWQKQCAPPAEPWLFASPTTERLYELNLQQKVSRVASNKLGIPNLGFHTSRHTYRSLLDASGVPIESSKNSCGTLRRQPR
jgi:hypothetical protein